MLRASAGNIGRILRASARISVPGGDTGSGSCDSICCLAPRCASHQLLVELRSMREAMEAMEDTEGTARAPAAACPQDLDHARSVVASTGELARYVRSHGSLCPPLEQEFARLHDAAACTGT